MVPTLPAGFASFSFWPPPRLLIGLLGTVGGMLRTFDGLSMQDSYKMDLVASGISEALVTTQAGLLVAIPALAFSHLLKRKKKGLVALY